MQKEIKVKELSKKKSWKKKSWPSSPSQVELLLGLIDIKVVSRVLRMARISKEQLLWCEEKMSKIDLSENKLRRNASPILFPCWLVLLMASIVSSFRWCRPMVFVFFFSLNLFLFVNYENLGFLMEKCYGCGFCCFIRFLYFFLLNDAGVLLRVLSTIFDLLTQSLVRNPMLNEGFELWRLN